MSNWFGVGYEERRRQDEILERLARQVIRMFMSGRLGYLEQEELTRFAASAAAERLRDVRALEVAGGRIQHALEAGAA